MKSILKKSLCFMMIMFFVALSLNFAVKVSAAEIARFEFGANDASKTNETNQDGSSCTSYTETASGYTLTLTSLTNVYKGSYDAKGNSCLKLGTSKKTASLTFEVPADVTEVGILVAGYKAKTVGVSVNGGTKQDITTLSANGEYTEVKVDTSSTKTITFATSTNYRCKIDAIVFYNNGAETNPSIKIEGDKYTEVEDVVTLTATTANVTGDVVWTSSDTNVAEVDQSGNVTAKAFGKTTITASADEVEDTLEFIVYPTDGSVLTIAEALQVCEYTGAVNCAFTYSTTGVIEAIADEGYNAQYNNITVTITDGENSIMAYRMAGGEDLAVGDKITVTGALVNHEGNTPEFVTGCTYVKEQTSNEVTSIRDILSNVNSYMSLAFTYSWQKVEQSVGTTYTAEYTAGTTTNMAADSNNAATIGLDEKVFNVTATKGGNSNNVGLNKSGQIRLYASSGEGNTLTIATLNEQNIVSVAITFGSTVGSFTVNDFAGDSSVKNSTVDYKINDTKVAIQNTTTGDSTQLYILSISITLEGGDTTNTVTEYSDSNFRFKCGIDSSISEEFASLENVTYGIEVTSNGDTKYFEYTSELLLLDSESGIKFVIIDLEDVLNNKDRIDDEFTVRAYAEYDGITHVSENAKTYSVYSIVQEYINQSVEAVDDLKVVLENFGYAFTTVEE